MNWTNPVPLLLWGLLFRFRTRPNLRCWGWLCLGLVVVLKKSALVSAPIITLPEKKLPYPRLCRTVNPPTSFDLYRFTRGPWYAHEAAETWFLTPENFHCVKTEFERIRDGPSALGYTYIITTKAQDNNGVVSDTHSGLCIYQVREEPAKLEIVECHLPRVYSSPYWVVAYKTGIWGYAIVSGGQPTVPSKEGSGHCSMANTRYGFWIYTREQNRNNNVIVAARAVAYEKGFDLNALRQVVQEHCPS